MIGKSSSIVAKQLSAAAVFFSIAALTPLSFAQRPVIISAIDIRGNQRVPASTILKCVQSQPKQAIDINKVDNDIKRIYHLGSFRTVLADLEKEQTGKTVLVFKVFERAGNLPPTCLEAKPGS